jgi:hypothetical protein
VWASLDWVTEWECEAAECDAVTETKLEIEGTLVVTKPCFRQAIEGETPHHQPYSP